ncbi:hypothetical protein CHGG_07062 [Chaetomium globosum CBS 148.51]|uniref:Uncharacterized protein n=1 Tax=Chaetomium globosum (strain ATCC 6205 / CBS 148.51 / DSM 1962 / NBRC 6347 / NRRL 1970) TaxID=306901 RepID=Q2GY92_CHAGB|nr:uncharacterized protein CHGG_07062 [Chaetomium globosum CBS 148.51]EAQ85809.1 hypothetical protein CHGG_07062 [Chaetomium globosum CBS 148.51]
MQRSATTPTQSAAPFFSTLFGGGGGTDNTKNPNPNPPLSPTSKTAQRPTSPAEEVSGGSPRQPKTLTKDRKPSFGRKSSFVFLSSPSKKAKRRRADSGTSNPGPPPDGGGIAIPNLAHRRPSTTQLHSEDSVPPLPDPSPKTTDGLTKMLSRGAATPIPGYNASGSGSMLSGSGMGTAGRHEGRIYWFNTLLFDKPDLLRMPYFDARKLGRRATNYLLLGISLPAVIDLNSHTPVEFLRSLNTLLAEFDAFQQIHTETGIAATSLTRTRIPQMFRRAAAPQQPGRGRPHHRHHPRHPPTPNPNNPTPTPTVPGTAVATADAAAGGVMAFGASEVDLLPGEEYTYLLTPTLPFDPDFFETFATLCDVLIDTYSRLLSLVPTARDCGGAVAELFTKADGRIRKLFLQAAVREFEDGARAGGRAEVASVGRVVLNEGGEMRVVRARVVRRGGKDEEWLFEECNAGVTRSGSIISEWFGGWRLDGGGFLGMERKISSLHSGTDDGNVVGIHSTMIRV